MKSMIYKNYGSSDVLYLEEIDKPIPKAKEILVKLNATTVTTADCMMRKGDTFFARLILGFRKPKSKYQILGIEFSGIVEFVGNQVKQFKQGDKVYGFRGFGETGCYANYKCISENASVSIMPENKSFEEAVSFVDGSTTALFFLKEKAKIHKDQKILINGASGSIGTFAVQLAKYFGAEVTGVCSTKNIDLVKSLGADYVIDYTTTDFIKSDKKYDIIFDTVTKSSFRKCKPILNNNGQYIVTVISALRLFQSLWTKMVGKKKVIFAMSINKKESLKFIRNLIEEGKIKSVIDKIYSFEQLPEAHKYVDTGRKRGNVVIKI